MKAVLEPTFAGAVAIVISAAAYGVEIPTDTFPVLSSFAAAAFVASILGVWYRQKWPRWRRVHVAFVWCSLVSLFATAFLLRQTDYLFSSLFAVINVGWLLSSLGAIVSGICVVPLELANLLRDEPAPANGEHEWTVDMESVVGELYTTVRDFYDAVSRQRMDLENAVSKMQERVESQKEAMNKVKHELTEARSEIKQRETITRLTPEQQVLIGTLSGIGRLKNYWVGFVSGLSAAFAVELFRWGVGLILDLAA